MYRQVFIAAILIGVPALASADQCAWIAKPVAEKAVDLLAKHGTIQQFCASCGDKKATSLAVHNTAIGPTSDPQYVQVTVDGSGIDLAYAFIPGGPDGKKWVNLGLAAQCDDPKNFDTVELAPDLVPKP